MVLSATDAILLFIYAVIRQWLALTVLQGGIAGATESTTLYTNYRFDPTLIYIYIYICACSKSIAYIKCIHSITITSVFVCVCIGVVLRMTVFNMMYAGTNFNDIDLKSSFGSSY